LPGEFEIGKAKAEESVFDIETMTRFEKETVKPIDWEMVRRRLYVWVGIMVAWSLLIWLPLYFWIRPEGPVATSLFGFLNMVGIGLVELGFRFRFKEWYE